MHAADVGARIEGVLDFEDATLRCPLHLESCYLDEPPVFERARLPRLTLSESHTPGFRGDGMVSAGPVFFDAGFAAKGGVQLEGATIRGNLDCEGTSFENEGDNALFADGLDCKGSLFLRGGFTAKGEVRLLGATMEGVLDCTAGTFDNEGNKVYQTPAVSITGDWRGKLRPVQARHRTREPLV